MLYLMLSAYNLSTLLPALISLPALCIIIALTPKYRLRIAERLGWNLRKKLAGISHDKGSVIWVHALSVGETTSVLPLVKGLRDNYPDITIIFSTTTGSGQRLAMERVAPFVDAVIPAPLDLLPTILFYISTIRPNIFILTETDFWPNWQFLLHLKGVKTILVNGRISEQSFSRYCRFAWFFRRFFSSFHSLSMQSQADKENMRRLGIPEEKVHTLGNLKLDSLLISEKKAQADTGELKKHFGLSNDAPCWICGSTHPGEEALLLSVFQRLRTISPQLQLVLAPRNIDRNRELYELATEQGFITTQHTQNSKPALFDVLILDTIGELASLYQAADAAFIGGSLVNQGGHNPLEPAAYGVPVSFGPHMEDFLEQASALVQCGGAEQVENGKGLSRFMEKILLDDQYREQTGKAAESWIRENQGVVKRHLDLLSPLLPPP